MAVGSVSSEDVRGLLTQYVSPDDADRLLSLARPSAHLVRATCGAGYTRLGGLPLLAPGEAWPRWGNRPLSLLAMLDTTALSDAAGDLGLPSGLLVNVFYDMGFGAPWSDSPRDRHGWRVLVADRTTAELHHPPPGARTYRARPLGARPVVTLPSWQEDVVTELVGAAAAAAASGFGFGVASGVASGSGFVSETEFGETGESRRELLLSALDVHDEECWRGVTVRHQVGGWPFLVHSPVWPECALLSAQLSAQAASGPAAASRQSWFRASAALGASSSDWRLLLQLDCDPELGWTWGDNGCLYFAVRADALRSGSLADVWAVHQTA